MDRVAQRLWRGVEEPVPRVAEGTSAVFTLPMLFGAFNHRSPRWSLPLRFAPCGRALELASILPCPAPKSTFSAAILLSASVVENSEQPGEVSTAEVLRLRAPSPLPRDPSVRRFAQDDESVGS
jgi:hypothetical protein